MNAIVTRCNYIPLYKANEIKKKMPNFSVLDALIWAMTTKLQAVVNKPAQK